MHILTSSGRACNPCGVAASIVRAPGSVLEQRRSEFDGRTSSSGSQAADGSSPGRRAMEATVEVSSLFSSHHGVHGTVGQLCRSSRVHISRAARTASKDACASCGQWQLRDHVRFAMLLLVANSFFCRSHAGGSRSKADAGLAAARVVRVDRTPVASCRHLQSDPEFESHIMGARHWWGSHILGCAGVLGKSDRNLES